MFASKMISRPCRVVNAPIKQLRWEDSTGLMKAYIVRQGACESLFAHAMIHRVAFVARNLWPGGGGCMICGQILRIRMMLMYHYIVYTKYLSSYIQNILPLLKLYPTFNTSNLRRSVSLRRTIKHEYKRKRDLQEYQIAQN